LYTKKVDPKDFVADVLTYYKKMNPQGFNFLKKILPNESPSSELEKIIDDRIQTNKNILNKNFSHILTNALLFIDVLAFRKFLIGKIIIPKYIREIEETIVNIVSLALASKINKTQYDQLFLKLFEASVRYTKFSDVKVGSLAALELSFIDSNLEKYYILDLAGMVVWNDTEIDKSESDFIFKLGELLSLKKDYTKEGLFQIDQFISKHKKDIPFFNFSNPIKHFYDHATQNVVNLITRNKTRLIKEISQSKELMLLLAKSTNKDLSDIEKKKVKKQLLDVCKSVPSLTIFLLPGGSLLLPILIKFIPQMLPSAFNENLQD